MMKLLFLTTLVPASTFYLYVLVNFHREWRRGMRKGWAVSMPVAVALTPSQTSQRRVLPWRPRHRVVRSMRVRS